MKFISKILGVLMLWGMLICVSGCKGKEIPLTVENYQQYLTIYANIQPKDVSKSISGYQGLNASFSDECVLDIFVTYNSDKYQFRDATITIQGSVDLVGFKKGENILLDEKTVAASAFRFKTIRIPKTEIDLNGGCGWTDIDLPWDGYIAFWEVFSEYNYKVVDVSGMVSIK